MTKTDFENIAKIIACQPYTDQRKATLDHFCVELKRWYPRFDERKFREMVAKSV